MGEIAKSNKPYVDVAELVSLSSRLPTVHVDREQYLRRQFDKHCDDELLEKVILLGPLEAGIPPKVIERVAKSTIDHETALVTLISTAAGIPGGWFMAATIPADLIQFHGAMIRTAQKLAYLHGWPELFEDKGENIDDETKNVLLVMLGVMYGVAEALGVLDKIAIHLGETAAKKVLRTAATETTIYPLIKSVSKALGIRMSKRLIANGIGKAAPIIGGVVSGAVTFSSFRPMTLRLNKYLVEREKIKRRAARRNNAGSK